MSIPGSHRLCQRWTCRYNFLHLLEYSIVTDIELPDPLGGAIDTVWLGAMVLYDSRQ